MRQHAVRVVESDDLAEGGLLLFRWECICRRNGSWVPTQAHAQGLGDRHVKYANQVKKPGEHKALRDVLRLN